jgi:hypothetical protein
MKVSDVIARDLKSLEAISFGIGRTFDYPFHYRIILADCFAEPALRKANVLAMIGQGDPVGSYREFTSYILISINS